jgi:hypothetical protein
MKTFALRVEDDALLNRMNLSTLELAFCETLKWEEWDTVEEAEARAKALRKQGASVEIYRLL